MFLFPKLKEQTNANIFDPQQGGEMPQGGSPQGTSGGVERTSTGGDDQGTTTQQVSPTTSVQQTPTQKTSAIMSRNKIDSNQSFANNIGNNISRADEALQGEANAYTAGENARTFDIAPQELSAGTSGDSTAYSKIAGLLGGTTDKQATAWAPKTVIKNESAPLTSAAGIQGALRATGGAQYNAGESGLDAALLGRSPEFQKTRETLIDKNNQLIAKGDQFAGTEGLEKTAQTGLDTRYTGAQAGVRSGLGTLAGQLTAQQQAEADAYNAPYQAIAADPNYWQTQKAAADATFNPTGFDPGVREDALHKIYNPESFYTAPTMATADQFINPAEASQFNNINTLLGVGGTQWAPANAPGAQTPFNAAAYTNMLQVKAAEVQAARNEQKRVIAEREAAAARLAEEARQRNAAGQQALDEGRVAGYIDEDGNVVS